MRNIFRLTFFALCLLGLLLITQVTGGLRWLVASVLAAPEATYKIIQDEHGEDVLQVLGSGSVVTLSEIRAGVAATSTTYLVNLGNNVWRLNINLLIDEGVTLNLSPSDGVKELQLRSGSNNVVATPVIEYDSFVNLRTQNGTINIDGVKVYSWDVTANKVDEYPDNGRAYLLARLNAVMNIRNADIGYLGADDNESYGLSWRDTNPVPAPATPRTRVTGEVINSDIHHNFYGIYTFQAQNMRFTGNKFRNSARYGFDPHDFSHDILVENNQSYDNGAHGFIISRGCYNITFRNNKAYNNSDPSTNQAHGFMIDPGAPPDPNDPEAKPQAPSNNNLLENNEAYNNEGFGLRLLGSAENTIRNNYFHDNHTGINLDLDSSDNIVTGNRLNANQNCGIVLRESSSGNQVTSNQINENLVCGVNLRANSSFVTGNTIRANKTAGVILAPSAQPGAPRPQNNEVISNVIEANLTNGLEIRQALSNKIDGNQIISNSVHGISMWEGASGNSFSQNLIRQNAGSGIIASGADTIGNHWSRNRIFANASGGIALNDGANRTLTAPILTGVISTTVGGTTVPGAKVEIFSDSTTQGQFYEGSTTAEPDGRFSFSVAVGWQGGAITAVTLDSSGDASIFAQPLAAPIVLAPTATPIPTVTATPNVTPTPTATATPVGRAYLPVVNR